MFRGGAAVAVPTTRPVGRLSLFSQQSGGALQQTAGAGPVWRRTGRVPDQQQPPPPPPPTTNCELKQKWRSGLNRRVSREPKESPKPEGQHGIPQWKRKQEQEKKPEESERKVEPLWKRIREAEKKQESEREKEPEKNQKDEKQKETKMERSRPEPIWKKKPESLDRLAIKTEPEKKPDPVYKLKQEVTKTQEITNKQGQERKTELPKKQELQRIDPVHKLEPLWKRKFEPVKKTEQTVNETPAKKVEPIMKRKTDTESKREPDTKQEPMKKPEQKEQETPAKKLEPIWKRKADTESKREPDTKQELMKKPESKVQEAPVKKFEPIWKRKTDTENKREPDTKQETIGKPESKGKEAPVKKAEPLWKRKIEAGEKRELETKQEPGKKPEPLWKKKKEPEKEPEQKTVSPKTQDSLGKNKQGDEEKNKKVASGSEKEQNTEDLPEEDETEEILCPMCSELFDEEECQPVLLPRCGHTFCRPCLVTIKNKGHFPCPTCRKRHLKPPVEDLPVHSEVLNQANAYREDKTGKCQTHQELLVYWCRNCQEPLCSSCRVMNGHNIVRTRVVLQEKRQEMKERGQTILDNVLEEKKKILDSVKTCSVQLLKVCEESVMADGSSQDVKEMLSDKKQTADLSFVLRSLERMKSILGIFSKAASDTEAEENTTPKVRRRRERRLTNESGDASTSEESIASEKTPNHAENKRYFLPKQEKDVNGNQNMNKTTNLRLSHQQPPVGGIHGSVPAEVMRQGPLLSLADASLWPLTCCVYTENGRRAQLSRKDGRLHMSALNENEHEAHFMIKLSVIQSIIPQDHPEVYLEVEAGEQSLGRIYIKLWGHLRRAHHFLALCMGTHGPSYRGAKFEEVFSRGLRGECLHAGPYLTPSGDLSAQRVMDALEWDGQFKFPQQKGLVVGAGSGRPDRDSCFDICTIENPTRHFACPFGEVVSGWDTVMAIIDYRPVRAVTMVDVGVVVPDAVFPGT